MRLGGARNYVSGKVVSVYSYRFSSSDWSRIASYFAIITSHWVRRERPRISKVAASHFVNVTEVFNVIKKIEFQRERKLLLRLSKTLSKARYEILL